MVVLCKSSRFDLEPRKASHKVDASSSPEASTIAVGDTVVMVGGSGEGMDLGRWTSAVACCCTGLSSPTGGASSVCWEAGKGTLTQSTGGSALPGGGVCVVGFMKGSGLRSEGGMWSGLEDADLLGFLVNSADFTLPETGTEPAAGVCTCELGAGLLEWPARGGVLLEAAFGSVDWD